VQNDNDQALIFVEAEIIGDLIYFFNIIKAN